MCQYVSVCVSTCDGSQYTKDNTNTNNSHTIPNKHQHANFYKFLKNMFLATTYIHGGKCNVILIHLTKNQRHCMHTLKIKQSHTVINGIWNIFFRTTKTQNIFLNENTYTVENHIMVYAITNLPKQINIITFNNKIISTARRITNPFNKQFTHTIRHPTQRGFIRLTSDN